MKQLKKFILKEKKFIMKLIIELNVILLKSDEIVKKNIKFI